MNEFSDRYKSYSNQKLVDIIKNPTDYQVLAVKAAKSELDSRNISEVENEVYTYKAEQNKSKKQRKKKELISYRTKEDFLKISDKSTYRIILGISIYLTGVFLFNGFREIKMFYFLVDQINEYTFYSLFLILSILIEPIIIILFWNLKKIGWILAYLYSLYNISVRVITICMFISYDGQKEMDIEQILYFSLSFIIHSFIIYFLNRKSVKQLYKINKKTLIISSIVFIIYLLTIIFLT